MKKMLAILSIGVIFVSSISCISCKKTIVDASSADVAKQNTTNAPTILSGSAYRLVSYNGKPIADTTLSVSLSWDNRNNLSASFCNTLSASAELKAGLIKSNVSSTKKACGSQVLMNLESVFAQSLSEGITLALKTNKRDTQQNDLYFTTAKGETFVFEWMAQFME